MRTLTPRQLGGFTESFTVPTKAELLTLLQHAHAIEPALKVSDLWRYATFTPEEIGVNTLELIKGEFDEFEADPMDPGERSRTS